MTERNEINLAPAEQPGGYLTELAETHKLCEMLMKTPHYAKMGPEGIFAIVETAKALKIDPRKALGGGLYYVKGKVEMSARMMNALIRSKGHSITKDKRSDVTTCILHGKRADSKDTWMASFSMDEAKKIGLTKNPVWSTYPEDMLFARALSRLARQLFPDLIDNCYVEGEISQIYEATPVEAAPITENGKAGELRELIEKIPEFKQLTMDFIKARGFQDLSSTPEDILDKLIDKAKARLGGQDEA